MKVFSVIGISKSGKTTTIENIIKALRNKRYTVGSVKEIHYEKFEIDTEGTNTYRHKKAGAELVTARGMYETDILYQEKLDIAKILKAYNHEYVVLEGVKDINAPRIITAHTTDEIDKLLDDRVFAISGKISNQINEYKGIPVINSLNRVEELVALIEEKVFERLPNFSKKCCGECGYSCQELCEMIIKGIAKRKDCILKTDNIKLSIEDKDITMVPFVQDILRNAVLAVVKELEGYKEGAKINIQIGEDFAK
ncbi:molybdopterin-guanine dinucleotide biosynthesis protein B [Clostridiaceae bacterium M8S5]|nr:molybdopterin-guanine dinucleotide biosynthesis protein B [Clostridiaceae bacterium M8S5]